MNLEKYEDIPNKVWVVCYKGLSGKWIMTSPTSYYKNATYLASLYAIERETYIIEYNLNTKIQFQNEPVKKIPKKKVRKVRQVV